MFYSKFNVLREKLIINKTKNWFVLLLVFSFANINTINTK